MHENCADFENNFIKLAEKYTILETSYKEAQSILEQQFTISRKHEEKCKEVTSLFEQVLQQLVGDVYCKIAVDDKSTWSLERKKDFIVETVAKRLTVYHQTIKEMIIQQNLLNEKNIKDKLELQMKLDKNELYQKEMEKMMQQGNNLHLRSEDDFKPLNDSVFSKEEIDNQPLPEKEISCENVMESLDNQMPSSSPNDQNNWQNIFENNNYMEKESTDTEKKPKIIETKMKDVSELTDVEKYCLQKAISSINADQKAVLKAFGVSGEYLVKEISNTLKNMKENLDLPSVYKLIGELKDQLQLIKQGQEKVSGGSKGAKSSVYFLTDVGKILFSQINGSTPVPSKLDQLVFEHKSIEHGHIIRNIAQELERRGYLVELENKMTTPSGRKTECDILAKRSLFKFRIEYEQGNYSDEAYIDKIERILEVTNHVRFIVKNQEVRNKIDNLITMHLAQKYGENFQDKFRKEGKTKWIITAEEFFSKTDYPIWKNQQP